LGVLRHDRRRVQHRRRDGIEECDTGFGGQRFVPTGLRQFGKYVSMRQLGIIEQILDVHSRARRDAYGLQLRCGVVGF